MLDAFKDLWNAMEPKDREDIAWLALKGDRFVGEGGEDDMLRVAAAAIDSVARFRSKNYEEYREQAIAICQGLGIGLMDGGMYSYLKKAA